MKKISLLILSLIFAASVFSQAPFVGPMYTKTSTWLFSKYVSDQGDGQDYGISGGQNFGLYGGYDVNDNIGFQVELLINQHRQNYKGVYFGFDYNSHVDLKTLDIPVLLKLGKPVYFEIGPVFSFINKATYYYEAGSIDGSTSVKSDFKSSNIEMALGLGGDITLADNIFLNLGLRVTAGTGDIYGVDALGRSKDDLEILAPDEASNLKTYTLAGGVHIGIKYVFDM